MLSLPPITLRLRGWKLIDRVALAFLLLCSIALGAACGFLFVYASDLPEIRALETYRPNVVTEIYADDGQLVGSFALQRRILMTYEQCPKVLYNSVTAIEDQQHAACRQSFPGSQRPQFPPQDAGDAAGAANRAPLYEASNLHHVRQSGLPGARKLRLCRRRGILLQQERHGFEAAGSRAARRHGQWPEIFAARQPGGSAGSPQSRPAPHGGRRPDHVFGGSGREEVTAGAAYSVSAQRFGSIFL